MRLIGCCALFLSVFNQCAYGSMIGQENGTTNDNEIGIKCLKTLLDTTNWESKNFVIIFDHDEVVTDTFFEGNSNVSWRFLKSTSKTTLSGFSNVILYTDNFESLNETLSSINIHRVDTYANIVIKLRKSFADVDEIRGSSTGTSKAMWNLDKTRVVYLVPCRAEILVMTYFPFAKNCRAGELEVLDVCTENGFKKNAELFPEKMLDVRGCVHNYSYHLQMAALLQGKKEITKTGETVIGGVGGKLAYIIAEKMNMVLHLLPEEAKTLKAAYDQIERGESLFSVSGNIPDPNRTEYLQFTSGYMEETRAFGYTNGDLKVSWKNLIWPLTSQVWAYTGCTFIFFSGLVLVANRYHRRKTKSDKLDAIESLGMFLGTGRSLPSTNFARYLAGIWICYSYLITASYNCGLVGFLTNPNEKRVINTLEEMLATGNEFGGQELERVIYNDQSDPIMKQIYDRYKIWNYDDVVYNLRKKRGFSHVYTSTLYTHNSDHIDEPHRHLHMLKDKAFTLHAPIVMRRGSPLAVGVLRYASQAVESGFNLYWFNQYTLKPAPDGKFGDGTPIKISMLHVRGLFCLHVLLLTCSSVVFLVELLFHKHFSSLVSESKNSAR